MMKFGKFEEFAIEAMVEDYLEVPSAMWGRMRVWVDGQSFGDIDDPNCSLYCAYSGFKDTVENFNKLADEKLNSLSCEELYHKVDEVLYGKWVDDELVDEDTTESPEDYLLHNFLTNWGEMFDQTNKCFIFKASEDKLRILQASDYTDEAHVNEYCCSSMMYLKTVKEFLQWYENTEAKLSGKDLLV